MITLTKNGNAIVFTFEDNAHYLFDGTIEVPINSLTLITDNSQMATFKKSASNDVFISARYDELGMSKAELESWFKENACGSTGGGGGVTSGEVETMIDQAISGKQDTLIAGSGITISGNVISSEGGNKVVELTQAQYDALVDKDPDTFYIITDAEAIDINNYYTKTAVDGLLSTKANTATTYNKTEVDTALANKADTSAVTEAISSAVSGKVNTSAYNTYTAATDSRLAEDEEVTAAGLNALNDRIDAIDITVDDAKAYYISFATIATTGIRDEDWDGIVAAIDDHRPIYVGYPRNDGGILYYGVECMNKNGNNTQIILTSSDDKSHYFYTFTKNGSNDYSLNYTTKPYVTDAEKTAWNAKQDALSAGTGIEISGNVISATGGGGATYSAGTNISIANDTINCTLPITAGTYGALSIGTSSANATRSFAGGEGCGVNAACTNGFSFGLANTVSAVAGTAFGFKTNASVYGSFVCGKWNDMANANTGEVFGSSGNTVFAVGNGWKQNDWTSGNATKHNAIDIRQNGDIYIADTNDTSTSNWYEKPMIKLQDQLGGGSITVDSALDATSENPVQNKVIYAVIGDIESLLSNI